MSKTTTDLVEIEQWVKERDGVPSKVNGTDNLLRVKFDNLEEDLVEITWAEFYKTFKENNLQFLYDPSEEDSRFHKFISEE